HLLDAPDLLDHGLERRGEERLGRLGRGAAPVGRDDQARQPRVRQEFDGQVAPRRDAEQRHGEIRHAHGHGPPDREPDHRSVIRVRGGSEARGSPPAYTVSRAACCGACPAGAPAGARGARPTSPRSRAAPPSTRTYATGTTMSVSAVAMVRPPMTAIASGARRSAPRPMPSAIGSRPSTVVTVVIRIGRRRARPASRIASRVGTPRSRAWRMKSTFTIASLTTMPTRITRPIKLIVLMPA